MIGLLDMLEKNHKILALSSSRNGDSGYLETALPHIQELLGSTALQIAFIPFALANMDYEGYTDKVKKGLKSLPHPIISLLPGKEKKTIEKADVIMVGGGNTFKLLHDLQEADLIETIRNKINTGTPYISWSAGSNILSPGIFTTNDMPVIQPQSFEALNIFPFQLNPHYNNELPAGHRGETRDQRLEEFLLLNPDKKIVALPEGTGLLLENGNIKITGDNNATLFYMQNKKMLKAELDSASLGSAISS